MYIEYSYVRPFKVIQFSKACNPKELTLIKLLTKEMVIIRIFLDLDIKTSRQKTFLDLDIKIKNSKFQTGFFDERESFLSASLECQKNPLTFSLIYFTYNWS